MVKINKTNDTEQLCKGNISQEKHLLIKVSSLSNSLNVHLYRSNVRPKKIVIKQTAA